MQAQQQATEAWSLTRKGLQNSELSRELDGARPETNTTLFAFLRRHFLEVDGSRGWGLGGSEVAGLVGFASATSRCVSPTAAFRDRRKLG